jgi:hypothetical protein
VLGLSDDGINEPLTIGGDGWEGDVMTTTKFGVGQLVRRVAGDRTARGAGRYPSDLSPENAGFAVIVRSPRRAEAATRAAPEDGGSARRERRS